MVKGIDNAFDHVELCLVLQAEEVLKWKLDSTSQSLICYRIARQKLFATFFFDRWQMGFSGRKFVTSYCLFWTLTLECLSDW